MKIMRVIDKKVDDTIYYKYRVNLPKKIVEEGNFKDKEIDIKLKGDKIIIERINGKDKENKSRERKQ